MSAASPSGRQVQSGQFKQKYELEKYSVADGECSLFEVFLNEVTCFSENSRSKKSRIGWYGLNDNSFQ